MVEKANIPATTVRYYTELGILSIAGYTEGKHALYDERTTLEKIKLVNELSKRNLELPHIKEYISGTRKNRRIAIIDDDATFSQTIKDHLSHAHPEWVIAVSNDVFEAGNMLAEFLPDLVILDLYMPGVKGFKICEFIRAHPILKSIKVVSLTSYNTEKNKNMILQAGADAYLSKTDGLKPLDAMINELLVSRDPLFGNTTFDQKK